MVAAVTLPEVAEKEWLLRPYDENVDKDGLLYLLGVAYSRTRAGWRAGVSRMGPQASADEARQQVVRTKAFLEAHMPIWQWLLNRADVTVAVDRESPQVIWGWMITSEPNVVHAIGVKRSLVKAGLAKEVALDLCAERWTTHQVTTLELPQVREPTATFKSSDLIGVRRPHQWSIDPTWLLIRMGAK